MGLDAGSAGWMVMLADAEVVLGWDMTGRMGMGVEVLIYPKAH